MLTQQSLLNLFSIQINRSGTKQDQKSY